MSERSDWIELQQNRANAARQDTVIDTVSRIRSWMALECDTGKDLDGLLEKILQEADRG